MWCTHVAAILATLVCGTLSAPESFRSTCPNGWMTYEDSCYLFADEINLDWTEATHFCRSHEATLAVIESYDEDHMLVDQSNRLFKPCTGSASAPGASFWIGSTDDEEEGQWLWYTDHHRLAHSYHNWQPGEPDNGPNQDCLVLYGPYHFKWGSAECSWKVHAICEKNMTINRGLDIIG